MILVLFHVQAAVERNFSLGKSFVVHNITELSIINKKIIKDHMHSNKFTPISIHVSKDMIASFKAAKSKYDVHLEEEQKKKIISEKVNRKKVINEEIKSLENSITEKQKESLVFEKEAFEAMEKSVTADAAMIKVFAKKAVAMKRCCEDTKKELETLEKTLLELEAKKAKL